MSPVRYEVNSGQFRVAIKERGAELCSFMNHDSGREYIWQADPRVWAGSAPVLFPIVGRLKNDRYEYDGCGYAMPGHGVVRDQKFSLRASSDCSVTLACSANAQTRVAYPFDFDLTLEFRLTAARLAINHTVRNIGATAMPFTLGAHPAFNLCDEAVGVEDYQIEFSRAQTLDLFRLDGTLIGRTVTHQFVDQATTLALQADSFNNDALIFKNISAPVIYLVRNGHGRQVSIEMGGAPHLGIWAKPGARYVCIEPWHGHSDTVDSTGRMRDKPSMMWLDPGYSYDWSYAISVY